MTIFARIEGEDIPPLSIEGPLTVDNHTVIAMVTEAMQAWFTQNGDKPIQLKREPLGFYIVTYEKMRPRLQESVTIYPPYTLESSKR